MSLSIFEEATRLHSWGDRTLASVIALDKGIAPLAVRVARHLVREEKLSASEVAAMQCVDASDLMEFLGALDEQDVETE